jgi:virulence-associated protein VapD
MKMFIIIVVSSMERKIYYDPSHPGSFGGEKRLQRAVGKKSVTQWLQKQRAYSLHKPARKKYATRPTLTSHHGAQFQADLNDMQTYQDGGNRYILTVIDVFSRYAWARPLKSKTGEEVKKAFQDIFKEVTPHHLQTDDGTEYLNKTLQSYLKSKKVNHFTVKSQFKASLVERFNRTLKTRMFRYFTFVGNYQWVKVLPQLVASYNQSYHRGIGMSPQKATDPHQRTFLWEKQESVKRGGAKVLFKVGDHVRISKVKGIFQKGYTANWSEEIFTIKSIDTTRQPTMYTIQDENQEEIQGKFYAAELQKVGKPESFAVEKVIRRYGERALVKFIGYPGEHWVDATTIKKI